MMWFGLAGSTATSFAMFLYGAFVSDEVDEPNVAPAICEPGAVYACSADGRFAGLGANASVHGPEVLDASWDHTPRRVAPHTLPPPKRRLPIVVDSSSLPPTRVQLVELVGLSSTYTPAPT